MVRTMNETPAAPSPTSQPGPLEAPTARDALIYIGPIGSETLVQPVERIAGKIAAALDRACTTRAAEFQTVFPWKDSLVAANNVPSQTQYAPFCTISRIDEDRPPRPVLDVHVLPYHDILLRPIKDKGLLLRGLFVLIAIIRNAGRMFRQLFSRHRHRDRQNQSIGSRTKSRSFQLGFALIILAIASMYMITVVIAAFAAVASVLDVAIFKSEDATRGRFWSLVSDIAPWFQGTVITVTALWLALPSRAGIKRFIEETTTDYLAVDHYLTFGERSNAIVGPLSDLIDELARRNGNNYRNYYVMAYSFGSLIAIDALFPPANPTSKPRPSPLTEVDTLITIGCPLAAVRLLCPRYSANRYSQANSQLRWMNFYNNADILSTADIKARMANLPANDIQNFALSTGTEDQSLSLFDYLTLIGMRAHTWYWSRSDEAEISAFDHIIPELYKGDDILS
jgi:hypothetical protein